MGGTVGRLWFADERSLLELSKFSNLFIRADSDLVSLLKKVENARIVVGSSTLSRPKLVSILSTLYSAIQSFP